MKPIPDVIWADSKIQKDVYKILDNAKKCADQNLGYKVFDADGKVVYEPKAAEPEVKVPFLVKVSISDLNVRKGPGVNCFVHRVGNAKKGSRNRRFKKEGRTWILVNVVEDC